MGFSLVSCSNRSNFIEVSYVVNDTLFRKETTSEPLNIDYPIQNGYLWLGWYDDLESEKPHDFSKPISKSTTLYGRNYTFEQALCFWVKHSKNDDGFIFFNNEENYKLNEELEVSWEGHFVENTYTSDRSMTWNFSSGIGNISLTQNNLSGEDYHGSVDFIGRATLGRSDYDSLVVTNSSGQTAVISLLTDLISEFLQKSLNLLNMQLAFIQTVYSQIPSLSFNNISKTFDSISFDIIEFNLFGHRNGIKYSLLEGSKTIAIISENEPKKFENLTPKKTYLIKAEIQYDKHDGLGVKTKESTSFDITTLNKFSTVTFKNYDGTILSTVVAGYGDSVVYNGPTPTRPATSQYRYEFIGWDDNLLNITSDRVVFAQYSSIQQFTVTFKNYDRTTLSTSVVDSGGTAIYSGPTPEREHPSSDQYSYYFVGWNRELTNVKNNFTTTAQYSEQRETPGQIFTLSSDHSYYIVSGYSGSSETVYIPNYHKGLPVKEIGAKAFYKCSLLENVFFSSNISKIGDYAFYYCVEMRSIYIPMGVISIGNYAFCGCGSNKSHWTVYDVYRISLANSVTSIGEGAFQGCTEMTQVVLSESLTSIPKYAFRSCYVIESITIPRKISGIGEGAFDSLFNIKTIIIPSTVTTMDENVFRDCYMVTIYAEANSKPAGWNSLWNPRSRPVVWGYTG